MTPTPHGDGPSIVLRNSVLRGRTDISTSTTDDIGHIVELEENATEPGHAPTSIGVPKT